MGSNLSQQAKDRIYTCRKNGKAELNLSDCALTSFPKVILKFKTLKKVTMARNLVPILPPELQKLALLETLDVSTNEIQVHIQDVYCNS
jgi:Leucine-rich repeat (LRR) protein